MKMLGKLLVALCASGTHGVTPLELRKILSKNMDEQNYEKSNKRVTKILSKMVGIRLKKPRKRGGSLVFSTSPDVLFTINESDASSAKYSSRETMNTQQTSLIGYKSGSGWSIKFSKSSKDEQLHSPPSWQQNSHSPQSWQKFSWQNSLSFTNERAAGCFRMCMARFLCQNTRESPAWKKMIEYFEECRTGHTTIRTLDGVDGRDRGVLLRAVENNNLAAVHQILDEPDHTLNLDRYDRNTGKTAIFFACENGNALIVLRLLGHPDPKINVNRCDFKGKTPLLTALENDHVEIAKHLLNFSDININISDINGKTALMVALKKSQCDIIDLLLAKHNIDFTVGPLLPTAYVNDYIDVVQQLLASNQDIDINAAIKNSITCLFLASAKGDDATVQNLVEREEIDTLNFATDFGQTPLGVACANGHSRVVRLLLSHHTIDVNLDDADGNTPLYNAAHNGHFAIVKSLLNHPDTDVNRLGIDDMTPLIRAAANGHLEIVKILLARKEILTNNVDMIGSTALLRASHNGHSEIVALLLSHEQTAVSIGEGSRVKVLKPSEYFMNTKTPYTPYSSGSSNVSKTDSLSGAITFGVIEQTEAVKNQDVPEYQTIENEVVQTTWDNPLIQNYIGSWVIVHARVTLGGKATGKWWVRFPDEENPTFVNFPARFLQNEENPTWKKSDWVEYHSATLGILKGQIISPKFSGFDKCNLKGCNHQFKKWTEISHKCGKYDGAELYLVSVKMNVNAQDMMGATALMRACWNGHDDVILQLLDREEINVNLSNTFGETALMWAAERGHTSTVELLLAYPDIKINHQAWRGATALLRASEKGWPHIVEILLEQEGIDTCLFDKHGFTALTIADRYHPKNPLIYDRIISLLIKHTKDEDLLTFYMNRENLNFINSKFHHDNYPGALMTVPEDDSGPELGVAADLGVGLQYDYPYPQNDSMTSQESMYHSARESFGPPKDSHFEELKSNSSSYIEELYGCCNE